MTTVEAIKSRKDILKIETILSSQNYRNLMLFTLGINSGLRISDILKLNVSDVKNKKYITLIEKKTGKAKKIPINQKLKNMFRFYTNGRSGFEPLFTTKYNNRLDRITAYRIINNACAQANIEINAGTHTLRKTFGFHHYKQFKDVVILQKIFNHSSPEITLRYIGIEQEEINNSYIKFVL